MLNQFNKRKIFITGHTGFKGSWLSIWLYNLGADITGYALDPDNKNNNFVLSNISERIIDLRKDIRDFNSLHKAIDKSNPEIIFHLAAQPLVIESYKSPLSTIETNINGTSNILEVFRQSSSAKILIVITTDKVYENKELNRSFVEDDVLGGNDLYSASKASTELLCNAYNESFLKGTDKILVTVRAGNVIGGGDWSKDRIVPDCIRSIENEDKIILRNPKSVRPWQHVLDPIFGYLLLTNEIIEKNIKGGAWNFGPDSSIEIDVETLVKFIIKIYGKGSYYIDKTANKYKESSTLSLNIDKVKDKIGWQPILDFETTIDFTVDWYKRYHDEPIFDICLDQIEKYEDLWKSKN